MFLTSTIPMKLILTVLFFLPLLFSCKQAQFTPKNYKGYQLVAGTSGGVTGMMKEYVLLGNGQLFLSKGLKGEWKEVRKLKKSKTKDIFNKAEELGLGTLIVDIGRQRRRKVLVKQLGRGISETTVANGEDVDAALVALIQEKPRDGDAPEIDPNRRVKF